jgi:hypothetical protein
MIGARAIVDETADSLNEKWLIYGAAECAAPFLVTKNWIYGV